MNVYGIDRRKCIISFELITVFKLYFLWKTEKKLRFLTYIYILIVFKLVKKIKRKRKRNH